MLKIVRETRIKQEIMFTVNPVREPWISEEFRVFVQNGDEVVLVRPCRYGWNAGYDYLVKWALHGDGVATILSKLNSAYQISQNGTVWGMAPQEFAHELKRLTNKLRKMVEVE